MEFYGSVEFAVKGVSRDALRCNSRKNQPVSMMRPLNI